MLAASAIAACSSGSASPSHPAHRPAQGGPLAGRTFYVDPANPAAQQALQWRQSGRAQDAEAIAALARQPTATWVVDDTDVFARVRSVTGAAAAKHQTALFVAYFITGRDCGSFSAGGATTPDQYKRWVSEFASAIGSGPATVIVEPDAVAQLVSGCVPRNQVGTRLKLLKYAVHAFSALPHAVVYLDAGNAGWINPVQHLVKPLRKAGIGEADGFALNVSNFYGTTTTIHYGNDLSHALGGKHYVIDTSRNGKGPYNGSDSGGPNWCNPPGRAVGPAPTTSTGQPLVDAYLWIKTPGESDGSCRPGEPPAGQWWPEYALGLVRGGA